ncbi:hypothetical protein Q8F55_002553 [Vanrija albida]|uniref:Uncharacterized protein n=1 Tax=Vanrija albida TaxID=181172 RepID=A0ABR3QA66_9TREE
MRLWPSKSKKTRIKILAEARSTHLHWDAVAKSKEHDDNDPFAPLRALCPTTPELAREALEDERAAGRPQFRAVAEFELGLEFDALLDAINSCTLDSLAITVEAGGIFRSMDAFVEKFIDRLELRLRMLHIVSVSRSLSLHDLRLSIPAIARYIAGPRAPGIQEIGIGASFPGHPNRDAAPAFSLLVDRLDRDWSYGRGVGWYPLPRVEAKRKSAARDPPKGATAYYRFNNVRSATKVGNTVLRALAVARVLLLAQRGERTGFADLPAEIVYDIVRHVMGPTSLSARDWGVILRHAADRDALRSLAAEFARQGIKCFNVPEDRRGLTDHHDDRIRAEWMYNGGFLKWVNRPEVVKLGTGGCTCSYECTWPRLRCVFSPRGRQWGAEGWT